MSEPRPEAVFVPLRPFRLPSERGELAVSQFESARGSQEFALICPPFAEEMNKCRRMLALAGRALARAGVTTLLPDLFGTGDSDGEFRDASYAAWIADMMACRQRVESRGGRITSVLGLRFGALLALDLASRVDSIRDLLLWQPVWRGSDALNAMLRLRVAASRMASDDALETVAGLRETLQSGRSIEVAGYEISPQLAADLDALGMEKLLPASGQHVSLFYVASAPAAPLPPAVARAVEMLASRGAEVSVETVAGERFWATVEIGEAPILPARTAAALRSP